MDIKTGDKINLENDMVGKYIDKLLHFDQQETNDKHTNSTLTMEMLRNDWILNKKRGGKRQDERCKYAK